MITIRFKRRKLWLVMFGLGEIIFFSFVTILTILLVAPWLLEHGWTYGLCAFAWTIPFFRVCSFEPGSVPVFRVYVLPFIPITRIVRYVEWDEHDDSPLGFAPITIAYDNRSGRFDKCRMRSGKPRETFEWLERNIFTPTATVVVNSGDEPHSTS